MTELMNNRRKVAVLAGFLAALYLSGTAQSAEPGQLVTFFQAEQFEYRASDGQDSLNWDVQGWIGNDDHKAWLKTEGEKPTGGRLEKAEIQLLYSRQVSDFFDAQAGVRYDFEPGPERGFGVFALHGLAPYWFEIDASAFISNEGEISARFEAEYDLLITQKLILRPNAEVNLAVQSVRERGIGSGISDVEIGLRLHYEIERKFAPYIGTVWERKIGETADFARDEEEDVDNISLVAGVRFSF